MPIFYIHSLLLLLTGCSHKSWMRCVMRAECVVSWIYSHLFISARHIRLQNMSTVLHTTVLDNQVANSLNCLLDANQTQDHTEKSGFWAALTSPWHPQNHLILGCSEKKLPTSQIKSIFVLPIFDFSCWRVPAVIWLFLVPFPGWLVWSTGWSGSRQQT